MANRNKLLEPTEHQLAEPLKASVATIIETDCHMRSHPSSWIPRELAEGARLRRVDTQEGGQIVAHGGLNEDRLVIEVRGEIAGLLASAYRRLGAIRRVGSDQPESSGKPQLATWRDESVHGGVE